MITTLPLIDALLEDAHNRKSYWHGEKHWRGVAQAGWYLANADPLVDLDVVFLFAVLHDSRRQNENADPHHGRRAAERAAALYADGLLPVTREQFEMLDLALFIHNGAHPDELAVIDMGEDHSIRRSTIATCLDADRLNLWRVGKEPDPSLLCTRFAARPDVIRWGRRLCAGYCGTRRNDALPILTWSQLVSAYHALASKRVARKNMSFPRRYGVDVRDRIAYFAYSTKFSAPMARAESALHRMFAR